eukprot:7842249-Pyramimonas_sp.AAC.1
MENGRADSCLFHSKSRTEGNSPITFGYVPDGQGSARMTGGCALNPRTSCQAASRDELLSSTG